MTYDIIIKNGILVDGNKAKGTKMDIAVSGDTIVKIAPSIEADAIDIIDIEGLIAAPGFIDIHSHSDTSFLIDDKCESKLYQGVTTEVAGQCGSTIYSCEEGCEENLRKYVGKNSRYDSEYHTSHSLEEFIDKAKKTGKSMANNLALLTGHNALRSGIMGLEGRTATDEEISRMCKVLEKDMEYGSFGMSVGLGYTPGIFSNQEELNRLGAVVSKYDGMIASHMRNQGSEIFEALEEMCEIYRVSGTHVHIAHLKMSGRLQWGTADKLIDYLKGARESGINITGDIYPYEASSSGITNVLPKWTLAGGKAMAAQRLRGRERENILQALRATLTTNSRPEGIYVVTTYGRYPIADGKTIKELSEELGLEPAETVAKVVVETDGMANCISVSMSEDDVMYMLKEKDIPISSDGRALSLDPDKVDGKPHPRNYGTFPRFLRLCRETGMMSLEDSVYKITALPAEIMGIKNRGMIKEGYFADIVVFDGDKVSDTATYKNPISKPIGIEHVIVNGKISIRDGQQTKERAGRFILKNKQKSRNG